MKYLSKAKIRHQLLNKLLAEVDIISYLQWMDVSSHLDLVNKASLDMVVAKIC